MLFSPGFSSEGKGRVMNLKITTKIYIGFGAVLLLLCTVATFGVLSLIEATDVFGDYRKLARQTNADGRVQANMLMTRIFAKNFVIEASDENIEGVKERAARTLKMIEASSDLSKDDSTRQLLVDDLKKDLDIYLNQFDQVTELQAERNKQVNEKLNILGPKTERALTAIMNSALDDGDVSAAYQAGVTLRSLMLGRLYANRFLIQNDNPSVDRALREFRDMEINVRKLLGELENEERRALAEEVKTMQEEYLAAFNSVRRAIENRNILIKYQLDRIGPEVADRIERLKLSIKQKQDELGPAAQASLLRAETITTAISVFAIAVGLMIATFIAKGVSGPIQSITAAAQAMAEGKLDQKVDTDRNDEIGTLAKAFVSMRAAIDEKVKSLQQENLQRKKTEEKLEKAQLALKKANEELEEKVHQRTLELEEKDAQLRMALSSMSDGIYTVNADMEYTMFNERYQEITGLPAEHFGLGKPLRDALLAGAQDGYFGDGDPEEIVDQRIEIIKSPEYGELESVTPDGRIILARKSALKDGGAIVVVSDITEQREAERELKDAFQSISSSIKYASKIQQSILPHPELLIESFDDHFVYWEPRDVVGGDIYWFYRWGEGALLALGDCTGHGVPGAFMTLISTGALERAMSEVETGDLSALISRMNTLLRQSLGQESGGGTADDGLELGACYIEPDKNKLSFVGAKFDLLVVQDGQVDKIQGSRKGLGYREVTDDYIYELDTIEPSKDMTFYMATDGLVDQISSKTKRRLGKKGLHKLLTSIQSMPMKSQAETIHETLNTHQGTAPRLDDVAIVGFKVEKPVAE
jgi:serine phosphatase RsbU (regulator of sigma subunit)/CHASE3 domain sensor protein